MVRLEGPSTDDVIHRNLCAVVVVVVVVAATIAVVVIVIIVVAMAGVSVVEEMLGSSLPDKVVAISGEGEGPWCHVRGGDDTVGVDEVHLNMEGRGGEGKVSHDDRWSGAWREEEEEASWHGWACGRSSSSRSSSKRTIALLCDAIPFPPQWLVAMHRNLLNTATSLPFCLVFV